MKKIISLILTCVMLSASYGVLASDEMFSQASKTAELRYELDVIGSDTVIEETSDDTKKVSVKVKNYGDTQKSATLIAVFKEKATGAVYAIDKDSLSIDASNAETLSAEVLLPDENVIDDYEFKYYVWDNLNNMIAIGNTAPHKSENFKVKETSNSTITLSWDAAKDDAGVITYNIYCDREKIGDTTATTFTHYGLEEDTTYSYTVEAVDGCGLSSGETEAIRGKTFKIARLNMSEVNSTLNTSSLEINKAYACGDLSLWVTQSTKDAYDKDFIDNKTSGTFGFGAMTDSDGVEKLCLGSNDLPHERVMITIPPEPITPDNPDGGVLESVTKQVRITVLDNEAKSFMMRYSPTTGTRKDITFNLTGSGKWVTLSATLDDTYISSEGKPYTFELGRGSNKFGEIYVAGIEIVGGGKYVPKETSAEES